MKGVVERKRRTLANKRDALIDALRKRDGLLCHYCGAPLYDKDEVRHSKPVGFYELLTLDHRINVAIPQGKTELDNLVLSCGPCNHLKDATPYMIFLESPELRDRREHVRRLLNP